MTDHSSVLRTRDDGVIDVPGAAPVAHGLVETIEKLFAALGIPARQTPPQPGQEEQ